MINADEGLNVRTEFIKILSRKNGIRSGFRCLAGLLCHQLDNVLLRQVGTSHTEKCSYELDLGVCLFELFF